ncbi:MAG TPA: hypothetical protein VHY48_14470 [Acidobacteriaceae bacterium]|jgi:hypothetical protein|nr:hypothetical protein [Acidobacteriaceae bacterium]
MPIRPRRYLVTACAASFVLMLSLAGCSDDGVVYENTPTSPITGNWQVSSSVTGLPLPNLSGALTGSGTTVTGVLHADATTGCATAEDAITVTGATDLEGNTTITGQVAGGTLTIKGGLSADGRSLEGATYSVSGGQCAFSKAATAMVQNYSSVTGTYEGNFSDAGGRLISVVANLTQAPDGDTDGNFELSGTGSFPGNPCFVSPVSVVNSQVTGGSFTLSYTDSTTGNTVTATGTFSTDGTTLTVTNWTLTGPCGADSGTGLLAQQS